MVSLVRPAEIGDSRSIAHVHVATWRTTYRNLLPDDFLTALTVPTYEERWRRTIEDGSSRVYVAAEGSAIVGFASCGRERAGETSFSGELYAIYVLDQAQGRGHGRELVRAAVGGLHEMEYGDMIVWVLRDNAPARKFYERLGGSYVRSQPITIGPATLEEVSYGWRRLDDVRY